MSYLWLKRVELDTIKAVEKITKRQDSLGLNGFGEVLR